MLAPGYAADLIVIDTDASHFQPVHDITAALVWCTEPTDVRDVMVDGRWLMRDRQLLTIDEQIVLAGFRNALEKMMATPQSQLRTYEA